MFHVMCHVSSVMCQMSNATGHMSSVIFFLCFLLINCWSLLVEGLLSMGSTPSCLLIQMKLFYLKKTAKFIYQYSYFCFLNSTPTFQTSATLHFIPGRRIFSLAVLCPLQVLGGGASLSAVASVYLLSTPVMRVMRGRSLVTSIFLDT